MISPFKNREIKEDSPIEMYRCLNRSGRTYSIRQRGLVVGHTKNLTLFDCTFVVSNSGKERCIKKNVRNVHAYIKGYINGELTDGLTKSELIYNPFIKRGFHVRTSSDDINTSPMVKVDSDGIFVFVN